ncbi:MAG: AzlC family ABC transporter permease [Pseudomonadota bacterium]
MKITVAGVMGGIRALGPIAVFILPFGIAFGVAAIEKGMTAAQALAMSVLLYSAAAQFASLEYWPAGFPSLALALTIAAVSARMVIMGAALSPWSNEIPRKERLPAFFFLSDPNFADSFQSFQAGERDLGRLVGGGFILWIAWILGTAFGAAAGAQFGDLDLFGVDVLMAAYFTTMIVGPWLRESSVVRAVVQALPLIIAASAVAVVGDMVLPAGWNIVAAALVGGAIGGWQYGR